VSDAARLLLDRSVRYLTDPIRAAEQILTDRDSTKEAYETAAAVSETGFAAMGELMKAAIDAGDVATFNAADQAWDGIFEDVWLAEPWIDANRADLEALEALEGAAGSSGAVRRLIQYRTTLRFGLAMWIVRRIAAERSAPQDSPRRGMVISLANYFDDIEALFDAFEQATRHEEGEAEDRALKIPWTSWYLADLPEGQAHLIPTSQDLLFTALLLGTRFCGVQTPPPLRPRDWFASRDDEIQAGLSRLRAEVPTWSWVWGKTQPEQAEDEASDLPAIEIQTSRTAEPVERLAGLLNEARDRQQAQERATLRASKLDTERVASLRRAVLEKTRSARPLRDIARLQGAFRELPSAPPGYERQVYRVWIPKGFLTPESRVLGLDMVGGDLARATTRAEQDQLLAAFQTLAEIDDGDGRPADVASSVRNHIERMRKGGVIPSLIITPISWALGDALGLDKLWAGQAVEHPKVPPRRTASASMESSPTFRSCTCRACRRTDSLSPTLQERPATRSGLRKKNPAWSSTFSNSTHRPQSAS